MHLQLKVDPNSNLVVLSPFLSSLFSLLFFFPLIFFSLLSLFSSSFFLLLFFFSLWLSFLQNLFVFFFL